jgi:predicted Zn finger-like uncharacterized protein
MGDETDMAETMVTSCPECKTKIRVPEAAIGKKIRCKACEHAFVVEVSPSAAPEEKANKQAVKKQAPAPAPAPAEKKKAAPAPAAPKKQPAKAPPPAEKKEDDNAPMKFADDEEDDGQAYTMGEDSVAAYRCPQCAAEMDGPNAVVCLECGFNTVTRVRAQKRKLKEITGEDKFWWLFPGIMCCVGIIAMLGYWCFHHFALAGMVLDGLDDALDSGMSRKEFLAQESTPWYGLFFSGAIELWMLIIFLFISFALGTFAVKRLILHPEPPEVEIN